MQLVSTLPSSLQGPLFHLYLFPSNQLLCAQSCLFLSASTSRMSSECCSACSHAGSQCPHNSAEGELLHGWHRWWLYHLVKNQGHLCAGKDIAYLQHFSQCNCFSHINLKLQFKTHVVGVSFWCPNFQALFKLNKEPCNGSSTSLKHFEVREVSIHKMNVGEAALRIFLSFLWSSTVPYWSLLLVIKHQIRFGGNFDLPKN